MPALGKRNLQKFQNFAAFPRPSVTTQRHPYRWASGAVRREIGRLGPAGRGRFRKDRGGGPSAPQGLSS